ncbi:IclR family transcriptional regulator [Natronocalculus amylovorans]|uniref:IclR family transcriptional regulator n=1 Tax=Natronocalculus amylovorans TaxID=2917812 RepID=A0AAE3K9J8_9EURY|nr:IclR family transcriptional regulator [Natronocalculus amylovorans]MCL9818141.1 IclR family transcriptional regulator [Natronocalculus amylovorans]NUE03863.1 IclR family transcriptional regulator [Halorubraceae archaeon YAN]
MNDNTSNRVKSIETTIAIIEALQPKEGARVTEIATELDIAPSTVHRHLSTLHDHNFVKKSGDQYALGMRFLSIGGYLQHKKFEYRMAKTKIEDLAMETSERVQFVIEENGRRIYVHTAVGENAVETDSHIGKQGPLHCSAAGKAILANLPEPEREEILTGGGLEQITPQTITDPDMLRKELTEIRNTQIAFNKEESTPGLHAVGTAVTGKNDELIGGISVSGPAHRMMGDRFTKEIPKLLLGVANELELNIKYNQ